MLLYSLLHLSGYDLSLEEIKRFRQLHSKTPGHPEYGLTPGIETTTGPLGQGLANAVGMAIAEKVLAAQFNRDAFNIIDHYTYVSVGDGCLMEGISHEACSLAGTLGLGKLIAIYDDNGVSIDGEVEGWFIDDTPKRFSAYGWHVVPQVDGHDALAVRAALEEARAVKDKPSLICCQTVIGWGAPNKQGSAASHGSPLGAEEVALARQTIGWPYPPFVIPEGIYQAWDARAKGAALEAEWRERFQGYQKVYPDLAAELERRLALRLPDAWAHEAEAFIVKASTQTERIATRKASQNALNAYGPLLPELLGGSADLGESNLTHWSGSRIIRADAPAGNYIHYGVREFAMSAIMNGLALHGGFIPYGGTFLVFSDYARSAVRMAALMGAPSIFVYTHDSIGLGEDGPTHQAVEHAASLRLIPAMSVWRPCDGAETTVAWKAAIERKAGPTSLLLSRQALDPQVRTPEQLANIKRGGYVLLACEGEPEVIILATGSEVSLAVTAAKALNRTGRRMRVVSMPSTDVFDVQEASYRGAVLPPKIRRRVAVEAGASDYWYKYVGLDGRILGMSRFGESAPAEAVFSHFGFTTENLIRIINEWLV
jgi:transketolase